MHGVMLSVHPQFLYHAEYFDLSGGGDCASRQRYLKLYSVAVGNSVKQSCVSSCFCGAQYGNEWLRARERHF